MSDDDLDSEPLELQAGRDYYREGAAVVFTAAYHLRRGSCCGNRCRHCPYAHANVPLRDEDLVPPTEP